MKIIPYTCPRCNYTAIRKEHMRNHLFKRAKKCPAVSLDIELTESIKEYILENRIHQPMIRSSSVPVTNNISGGTTLQAQNITVNMSPTESVLPEININSQPADILCEPTSKSNPVERRPPNVALTFC